MCLCVTEYCISAFLNIKRKLFSEFLTQVKSIKTSMQMNYFISERNTSLVLGSYPRGSFRGHRIYDIFAYPLISSIVVLLFLYVAIMCILASLLNLTTECLHHCRGFAAYEFFLLLTAAFQTANA